MRAGNLAPVATKRKTTWIKQAASMIRMPVYVRLDTLIVTWIRDGCVEETNAGFRQNKPRSMAELRIIRWRNLQPLTEVLREIPTKPISAVPITASLGAVALSRYVDWVRDSMSPGAFD